MNIALALLSLGTLWGIGALSLRALGAVPEGALGRVTEAAAGIVLLAFAGTLATIVGYPLSPLPVYVLGVVMALVAFRRRTGRVPSVERPPQRSASWPATEPAESLWLARGLLVVAGAAVLWIAIASTYDRLWWDGWAIWEFKAHVLFQEGFLDEAFLDARGPYRFTHLDYPLAVPLLDWWAFRHAGEVDPALASLVGACWFALLPMAMWGGLSRRVHTSIAAGATVAIAAFWPIAHYATGGTADVVIAISLVGALAEMERGIGSGDRQAMWFAGLFLALAAMTKNEGLAMSLVFLLVAFGAVLARLIEPGRVVPLVLPLAALGPWMLFRWTHNLGTDAVAATTLESILGRLPTLLFGLGLQFGNVEWLPVVLLTVLALPVLLRHGWMAVRVAWVALGGYFAVLCLVYLTSPYDLVWLLTTSLPRVMGVLVPALAYLSLLTVFAAESERPQLPRT